MSALSLSRRSFLKAGGMLLVTLNLPAPLAAALASQSPSAARDLPLDQVDTFIAIAADGRVTAFNGHVDLGTGVRTALAQIVAEELDVAFDQVEMILGDTSRTPNQGPTIASATIQVTSVPLRQAAAEARRFLLEQAGQRFGVSPEQLSVSHGVVSAQHGTRKTVSYGELVKGQRFNLNLDGKTPLKPVKDYRIVGQPVPRVDIPAKLTGQLTYVHDMRLPGMLHGRVVRPPYTGVDNTAPIGKSLISVDLQSVAGLPGLVKVVVLGDFVGVVAEREEQAIRAARQLKVHWQPWKGLPDLSLDGLEKTLKAHPKNPRMLQDDAQIEAVLGTVAQPLNATYVWPYHLHASIGPSCGLADVKDDEVHVWSGSQNPHDLRADLAKLLKRNEAEVHIVRMEASGCYGRNGADDVCADAVLLSRAVGRPVRVQLMREQEHGWEPKGTAQLIEVRGGLNANHEVAAYDFGTCYPSNGAPTLALLLTGTVDAKPEIAPMGDRTAIPQYHYPHMRVVANDAAPIVRASWMRGVSALPNVFAHESYIDELAHLAGADPLAFRLRYLDDARALALIHAVTQRAGWTPRPSPNPQARQGGVLKGRGMAYARYFHSKFPGFGAAWAAWVADVEVNPETGAVKVTRVVVGHDCGRMINPDGVRHQVHGNVIQSLSRVLHEFATFNDHSVTSLEWGGYPILGFPDLPEIDVVMLDRPDEPPMGAGESASVPSAAAIANAIFDATGVRLRQVPFTPERVKAALQQHNPA
ncbi:xanthine dehydrogenase family protein molybdopterin-binding subunit [Paraburkholderia bonniea]|uniref:xanthine dehydrogenase family protein molybdopterin-binding subunit n=1 Tax=Paraburkholderia bonniea TaxID=2152891 RepID=UPI00257234C3|nr:xanthine dehydrogenase family protein molybdopterin-binding subunit [Paraburkholderia bonniea]WJF90127.1 xanthine dehydrogenase family protein molybdopterin-binding subunit [Paraburkholderia bonniea]WJF93441.1 xanthine dehydrogenase family protein molybdopterin-binding subunit [Paraburkholderia bonniea]